MLKYCKKCDREKDTSEFQKRTLSADGLQSYCRSCIKLAVGVHYIKNTEAYSERSKKYYVDNKETIKANVKHSYETNETVRQSHLKNNRNYKKNNRGKINADTALYKARKLQATPKWLTAEHHAKILEFYKLAEDQGVQVDHIEPLKGKHVCGLHVPWNLQLLTKTDNCKKGNR
jgi:hypothetical protein